MFNPQPVVLENSAVRLEPLSMSHAPALFASSDPDVWTYFPSAPITNLSEMECWIETALEGARTGTQLPFSIIEKGSGTAVGSTRYMDISRPNRSLEIGSTWISPGHQRSVVNTSCKLLLLTHAFETLGANRVQLKTDGRNLRSQRAIERIGAIKEGVLRKHMVLWNGFVRDTVYFSIIEGEWPMAKERLEQMLKS